MQASTPFHPETPQTIGPFRVLRLLGVGGMGAVYLAERMEQFSQHVAIKILHPHLIAGTAEAKLDREGQLLAALEHPGIVRVLDLGLTAGGLRYIVMDYVDGVPLDVYCDERRLPVRRRVEILVDVIEAVEYAHRHLVVHADLKPENILVTAEGKPRLLDFGVASILSEAGERESGEDSYTALYASPEQRSGERLMVASDIYSLGLIAQCLLIGLRPKALPIGILHSGHAVAGAATPLKALQNLDRNNRDSLKEIALARATTPSGLMKTVRGDIEAILAKSLRLDPKERFQSAQEMRDEFKRYLLGYAIKTRPAGYVTRTYKWVLRNRLAAGIGFVFLLAVLFSIVGVIRRASEAERKRQIAQTRLHDLVRLTDVLAGELYESVHGLEGSEIPQAALLNSAHQTMDKLAADDEQDPQLELELAGEYEKLARLELSRSPLTPEALRQSGDDLDKEIGILNRLSRTNAEAMRARKRLPELIRLRQASVLDQNH